MISARAHVMDLIFGRWRSQIAYVGVSLGVFDACGKTPRASEAIAKKLGVDPVLLYRLMRALGALELLKEHEGRKFTLTEAGELLASDHPGTLRGVTLLEEGPAHYALWKHLESMIREGEQNAFVREFGRMAFEHTETDPAYGRVFNEAMSSYSGAQTAWALEALEGYDFSSASTLIDVGGGHGHLLTGFLKRYTHLQGAVLEIPQVVEKDSVRWAEKLKVKDRFKYVPGDMFKSVPAADVYMAKMILHDWDDDECVQILSNARKSAPKDARFFVLEHLVPGPDEPHFAKLFDIHMMCWGTGRERTAEEYASLLERAGWSYAKTWPSKTGLIGAVEGRNRRS